MRLRPDVLSADTEYGVVLLDGKMGKYWQLNSTGALAFQALTGGHGVDHAVNLITQKFNVDVSTARRDVQELVHALHASGLVTL